jgi:NADPH-dependent 2,4-dienoyl-CoA reductase/sulfur reductase-like enzyme
MDRIPKSLAVIGGGVIGCEYASIFMALGVDVTLVDGRDKLLPFLDTEISERLRDRFAALGMHLWFNERPVKAENTASGSRLTMKSGKVLEVDAALFAAGRRAAVDGLSLEKAGLALSDKGYVAVDENLRRWGRDWFSGAGIHFDGARARGGVPCIWIEVQAARGIALADGGVHDSGDFRGGRDGGELQGKED